MSVSELSPSTQNYLKVMWALTEWSSKPITPSLIAERTGLKLSSVSDAVRNMSQKGLVNHAPYGNVELTHTGRQFAVEMIRRHRLIEAFLVRVLDYSWDQVHDEAEKLEHAVSDFMINRIDEYLGYPTRDPHGDPIPRPDGTVVIPEARPLTLVGASGLVTVERISDADPALLQFFATHGIVVGTHLDVSEGAQFSESLNVSVVGSDQVLPLGRSATDALYVSSND